MKMVYMHEEEARQAFARQAARHFALNPDHTSYGVLDGEPGWFAVRWGLGNDCVLVFKIDADHSVYNYQQLITHAQGGPIE